MKWYREVFRESLSTPPSQKVPPFRAHEVISLCVQYLVSFWGLLELFLSIEHSFMKLTFESRQCCVRLNCWNTINTFWGYFGDQILGLTWVLMYWPCQTVWSCCNSGMLSLTLLLMNFFLKVFTECFTILLLFYVLVFWPQDMLDLSSPTKVQTHTLSAARQSLNHWATREVPPYTFEVVWKLLLLEDQLHHCRIRIYKTDFI